MATHYTFPSVQGPKGKPGRAGHDAFRGAKVPVRQRQIHLKLLVSAMQTIPAFQVARCSNFVAFSKASDFEIKRSVRMWHLLCILVE